MSKDDFLDSIGGGKPKRKKGRDRVSDPTQSRLRKHSVKTAVAPEEKKVPRSMKAGSYVRQTITILPKMRKLIKKLATENRVSLLAFYRWLLDLGLQAYEDGARPEPSEPTYTNVKMGHWSSGDE